MTTTTWRTARCRSCSADIIWCRTPNGRNMPVDATPATDGNVLLRPSLADPKVPLAVVCTRDEILRQLARDEHAVFRLSHFATCPNADQHRRSS